MSKTTEKKQEKKNKQIFEHSVSLMDLLRQICGGHVKPMYTQCKVNVIKKFTVPKRMQLLKVSSKISYFIR
jgi:hypothetical protein